jgi:hypothetical protein
MFYIAYQSAHPATVPQFGGALLEKNTLISSQSERRAGVSEHRFPFFHSFIFLILMSRGGAAERSE